jgi:hypothetical protein
MSGARVRNRKEPVHGVTKTHFSSSGIVFCVIRYSFHERKLVEDWSKVTCGNCLKGLMSRKYREHIESKLV